MSADVSAADGLGSDLHRVQLRVQLSRLTAQPPTTSQYTRPSLYNMRQQQKLGVHTSPISLALLMQPLLPDEELRGHSRTPVRVETEPSILSASPYLPLNVVLSCLLDQPNPLQHIRYVVNAPLLHVQLLCRLSSPWSLTSL